MRATGAEPTNDTASISGMVEDPLHHLAAAVDQVDHARRQVERVQHLERDLLGERHLLRRLQDEAVAAADGEGQEPEGDHGREVEGHDGGAHAHGLAHGLGVHVAGDVLEDAALHRRGEGAGALDHLDHPGHLGPGVADGLAHLRRSPTGPAPPGARPAPRAARTAGAPARSPTPRARRAAPRGRRPRPHRGPTRWTAAPGPAPLRWPGWSRRAPPPPWRRSSCPRRSCPALAWSPMWSCRQGCMRARGTHAAFAVREGPGWPGPERELGCGASRTRCLSAAAPPCPCRRWSCG